MNFGFFDNQNKEYVITRPDTPTPWINYLGNGNFSGIISNNAGGLVFDRDPSNRRITRYKYGQLPMDRPGRYIYIKDMETGEYWSPTWQPVLKDLDFYECRHGLGYTIIKSSYKDIETEITYFIPNGKNYELWDCKIKNNSDKPRKLRLFSYVEWSFFSANVDTNAEWGRYEMDTQCVDGIIICDPSAVTCASGPIYGILGTSLDVIGYDCSRDNFIGLYRNENNPIVVEKGECTNKGINADHSCGVLSANLPLAAHEENDFRFVLGTVSSKNDARPLIDEAIDKNNVDKLFAELKESWNNYLSYCQINTPDNDMNTSLNIWHSYQCRTTFNWSRFISYYERGHDRGLGFRDSMQDVLGVMHAIPEIAKERIKLLLSIQNSNGNACSVLYPLSGAKGNGGRSDDHIWIIFSVCTYIRETGDYGFLNEVVPYNDCGEGTVIEHMLKGLNFTRENVGPHDLPLFLSSDWNDSISSIGKNGKAESSFVFFQAAHAAYELKLLFEHIGDAENLAWAQDYYSWCQGNYKKLWDGKWFIRAFIDETSKLGTDEDEYNKIFLNPQSWAVLSRLPSSEESNSAFDEVNKNLYCEYGLISHYPASCGYSRERKTFFSMKNGVKENGGIFCHANTWAVIAETMLDRNDEAFKFYRATIPARRNDKADLTLIEPYVYGSAMIGPAHERYGAASNSWLTGTASWMYFAATQYILGFRPDYDCIVIDPKIPTDWNGFDMVRKYRGTTCNVKVIRTGNKSLTVDGKKLDTNVVPSSLIEGKATCEIIAEI